MGHDHLGVSLPEHGCEGRRVVSGALPGRTWRTGETPLSRRTPLAFLSRLSPRTRRTDETGCARVSVHSGWTPWTGLSWLTRRPVASPRPLVSGWSGGPGQTLQTDETAVALCPLGAVLSVLPGRPLQTRRPGLPDHSRRAHHAPRPGFASLSPFARCSHRTGFARGALVKKRPCIFS